MYGQHVTQIHRKRDHGVAHETRHQIATVGTQPSGNPSRIGLVQPIDDSADLRRVGGAHQQSPEQGADLAAARHRGQEIEAKQQAIDRHAAQQPETKGRAASPASGQMGQFYFLDSGLWGVNFKIGVDASRSDRDGSGLRQRAGPAVRLRSSTTTFRCAVPTIRAPGADVTVLANISRGA